MFSIMHSSSYATKCLGPRTCFSTCGWLETCNVFSMLKYVGALRIVRVLHIHEGGRRPRSLWMDMGL